MCANSVNYRWELSQRTFVNRGSGSFSCVQSFLEQHPFSELLPLYVKHIFPHSLTSKAYSFWLIYLLVPQSAGHPLQHFAGSSFLSDLYLGTWSQQAMVLVLTIISSLSNNVIHLLILYKGVSFQVAWYPCFIARKASKVNWTRPILSLGTNWLSNFSFSNDFEVHTVLYVI